MAEKHLLLLKEMLELLDKYKDAVSHAQQEMTAVLAESEGSARVTHGALEGVSRYCFAIGVGRI